MNTAETDQNYNSFKNLYTGYHRNKEEELPIYTWVEMGSEKLLESPEEQIEIVCISSKICQD